MNKGVSPSGKAMDSDSITRRFESCYLCQIVLKQPSVVFGHFTNLNGFPEVSHKILRLAFFFVFFGEYSSSILGAAWTFSDSKT